MIESRVVELGELANNTLRSGQMWSLDRLVLHLVNTILQFGFTCIYYVLSIKSSQVRIQWQSYKNTLEGSFKTQYATDSICYLIMISYVYNNSISCVVAVYQLPHYKQL